MCTGPCNLIPISSPLDGSPCFHNYTTYLELFIVYDSFDVGHGVFGDYMCFDYPFYGVFIL